MAEMTCFDCGGSGVMPVGDGKTAPCTACGGSGTINIPAPRKPSK